MSEREMVTRREVARMAGVSEGTVSNVVNGKSCVREDTRERVLRIIRELRYVPNLAARNMVTGRSAHIGIAIYETTNPYHLEMAKKIEDAASKRGYIVSLFMLDENAPYKLQAISERRLAALVNFVTNQYPEGFIEGLRERGTVLVNFDPDLGPTYTIDYAAAMRTLLGHVYALGHRRIAYISSYDAAGFAVDGRGKQFFETAKTMPDLQTRVYYNDEFDAQSDEVGRKLAKRVLEDFPEVTAIFCINDLMAIGCMRTLAEAGRRVPRDISVIGCDDINVARLLYPSLTSMTPDKDTIGYDTANGIIDLIEEGGEPEHRTYEAKPVIRESVAPPPAQRK